MWDVRRCPWSEVVPLRFLADYEQPFLDCRPWTRLQTQSTSRSLLLGGPSCMDRSDDSHASALDSTEGLEPL